jgi:signal transduction histidine kinase
VVVAVDPDEWLYPLLAQPLAGTSSGEAFLVGRDGADILFLSPLHNRPGAPLSFRRPFGGSSLPARAALEGSELVGPLVDYRGVRVLWGGRRIPPSPWALVVKIDEKEALAEFQAGVRRTALAWGSLAVAFLGITWGAWQMRGRRQAAALARSEANLRALAEELETRVETRTAELRAANRELEAFSYSVSHDLRAPLRAVDGFSRILLEDHAKQLDAEGRRLLDVVRSNTRQMGQLIDDLLSFSRVGRQEMARSSVDMESLAKAAFSVLMAADERVSFTVGPLPPAQGDPSLMRQVWVNLISNALKFTRPKAARVIEVAGRTEPARVVYSVADNGVGFDMAYVTRLFGVFQRLHSSHEFEGTGVGLALVQRIVHRHGGEVWAEGKAGEGATFSFSLPRPGGSS